MTGQALGDAAFGSDPPQVALSRKNDRIAMNGRKSVVTTGRRTTTFGGADHADPKENCRHRKLQHADDDLFHDRVFRKVCLIDTTAACFVSQVNSISVAGSTQLLCC